MHRLNLFLFLILPLCLPAQGINTKAPELRLSAIYNKEDKILPTLASLKGSVVILDFWATWCTPCVDAFPANDELYKKYKDRGLKFIAITDDPKEKLEKFLARVKPTFWVGRDDDKKDFINYNVHASPTMFLLNRDGLIVYSGHSISGEMIEEVMASNGLKAKANDGKASAGVKSFYGFMGGDDPVYVAMMSMMNGKFSTQAPVNQFIIHKSLEKEMKGYGYRSTQDGHIGFTYVGGRLDELFAYMNGLPSRVWVSNKSNDSSRYDIAYYRKTESLDAAFAEIKHTMLDELAIRIDSTEEAKPVNILASDIHNPFVKKESDIPDNDPIYKTYLPIGDILQNLENKTGEFYLADKSLQNSLVDGLEFKQKIYGAKASEIMDFLKSKGIKISRDTRAIKTYSIVRK